MKFLSSLTIQKNASDENDIIDIFHQNLDFFLLNYLHFHILPFLGLENINGLIKMGLDYY